MGSFSFEVDDMTVSVDPKEIHPLTKEEIERRKALFLSDGRQLANKEMSLQDCTCFDCKMQKENRCVYQWDFYNTDGDCLFDK